LIEDDDANAPTTTKPIAAAADDDGPTTASIATAANGLTVYVHLTSLTPILILVLVLVLILMPSTPVTTAATGPLSVVQVSYSTTQQVAYFCFCLYFECYGDIDLYASCSST